MEGSISARNEVGQDTYAVITLYKVILAEFFLLLLPAYVWKLYSNAK